MEAYISAYSGEQLDFPTVEYIGKEKPHIYLFTKEKVKYI